MLEKKAEQRAPGDLEKKAEQRAHGALEKKDAKRTHDDLEIRMQNQSTVPGIRTVLLTRTS